MTPSICACGLGHRLLTAVQTRMVDAREAMRRQAAVIALAQIQDAV